MIADEVIRQREELRLVCTIGAAVTAMELSDVEKCHDLIVERTQRCLFDQKGAIAVSCVATLDLYSNLRDLTLSQYVTRIGMNTDRIVTFVIVPTLLSIFSTGLVKVRLW
jgi:hypothetical protein